MRRISQPAGTTTVWLLAVGVALFTARYFLVPQPWPTPTLPRTFLEGPSGLAGYGLTLHLLSRHRPLLLLHIGAAMLALVVGPFQFVGSLRASRPAVHRALGRVYLAAVFVSGAAGLPLSFLLLGPVPGFMRAQFYPLAAGFASLSLAWPFISAVALWRARQRRFDQHRAWMMRSYALTFAAVTVRLVSLPLLLLTGSLFVAFTVAVLSWPLNLVVAEWLIRRDWPSRQALASLAKAND